MRGYTAWLARMVRLGRVDSGGLRLRRRNGMITQSECQELERLAVSCGRCACVCASCARRARERGSGR